MEKETIRVKEAVSSAPKPNAPAGTPIDRFHPTMPQIPGVASSPSPQSQPVESPAGQPWIKTAGIIAMVVIVAIAALWWFKRALRAPEAPQPTDVPTAESPIPESPTPSAVGALTSSTGAVIVAPVEALSKPWSSRKFAFVKPLTGDQIDALAIRLPGGELWAFALKEPYGKCDLEFVTDLGAIRTIYGFRATHPMVVNPCSNTVYDPLKVGPLGGSTWARGEIVQGQGLRPPIAINVQVSGTSVIADRIE